MPKGGDFERSFCRELTAWWTDGEFADVLFWRTAMSGGRATTRKKKGQKTNQAHCGDIAAIDAQGKPLTELVTFELKRGYRGCNLHDLLDRTNKSATPVLYEWIDQARTAARSAGSPFWAIVHRRDRRAAMILTPTKLFEKLYGGPCGEPRIELTLVVRDQDDHTRAKDLMITAMPLDEFFRQVGPADVEKVHKAWVSRKSSSKTASPTSGRRSGSTRT